MIRFLSVLVFFIFPFAVVAFFGLFTNAEARENSFLGFDRNEYPGDASLKELRKTFSYTGYWLNLPPGATTNTWTGKRETIEAAGFGFLVLFNGRMYAELHNVDRARKLGNSDAHTAAESATREGFPSHTVIFLDQEQGGRLLPEQKAYLFAWIDGVVKEGFRVGVYCSGITAKEKGDGSVITAEDIRQNAAGRKIVYWVTNDACPPSPGCTVTGHLPSPRESGIDFADIWQFAQSPRRKDVAAACGGYSPDGNCYTQQSAARVHLHLDLNTSTSADPSHGRTH